MSRWTSPRRIGIGGIALGALAFWLALPPLAARTAVLPLALGLLAVAAGIWAASRQARRSGGGAIAAGLLGIAFGVLATRSSTAHLDTVVVWGALGAATLRYATPLTFAAIGGLFCERSGVINVALEGMLLTGAFFGIWGAIWAHSWAGGLAWVIGLAAAALAGMALAAIHAVWAISFKADQIISGTALNFLALGVTGYLFVDKYGDTGTPGNVPDYGIPDIHLHFLQNWTFIGPIFGQLNLMIWLSFVLLIATYVFVFRMPWGLRLRSVGRAPAGRGYRRSLCGEDPLSRRDRVRRDRGHGRRLPLDRLRALVQPGHDERHRVHRPRRADLRQVAPVPGLGRGAPLRLLERARRPAAGGVRQPVGHALPGPAVPAHPDRRRRRHRPLDRPRGGGDARMPDSRRAARTASALGTLAVLAVPAGVVAARYLSGVTLLRALYVAVPVACLLGLLAVVSARRAHFAAARSVRPDARAPAGWRARSPGPGSTWDSRLRSRSPSTASFAGRSSRAGTTRLPFVIRVRDWQQPP